MEKKFLFCVLVLSVAFFTTSCLENIPSNKVAEPHAHTSVVDEAVEAKCYSSGLTEGSHCYICGEVLKKQDIIPAFGHTVIDLEEVEPTCTQPGLSSGKKCSVCNRVLELQEKLPVRGHEYLDEWTIDKVASCTENGSKSKHCTICGENSEVTEIKGGHQYSNEWTIDRVANCTENGSKSKHCTVCGDKSDVTEIPKSHEYSFETFNADGVAQAKSVYRCNSCSDTYDIVWENDIIANAAFYKIGTGMYAGTNGVGIYSIYTAEIEITGSYPQNTAPINAKVVVYWGDICLAESEMLDYSGSVNCELRLDVASIGVGTVGIQLRLVSDEIPSGVKSSWDYILPA